jgi:hypothetical protein
MFEKVIKYIKSPTLAINPVPKIEIEGLPEDSKCTGCRFFQTLEKVIEGDTIGWMNPKSGAAGFCNHPYKVDKMTDCAWVDFGCVNRKEKVK